MTTPQDPFANRPGSSPPPPPNSGQQGPPPPPPPPPPYQGYTPAPASQYAAQPGQHPMPQGQYQQPGVQQNSKSWMNIVSLVTSLLCMSVVGIIFGHLGVRAANRGEADNKGLGLAGLIIGYIGLAGLLAYFVFLIFFIFLGAAGAATYDPYYY